VAQKEALNLGMLQPGKLTVATEKKMKSHLGHREANKHQRIMKREIDEGLLCCLAVHFTIDEIKHIPRKESARTPGDWCAGEKGPFREVDTRLETGKGTIGGGAMKKRRDYARSQTGNYKKTSEEKIERTDWGERRKKFGQNGGTSERG